MGKSYKLKHDGNFKSPKKKDEGENVGTSGSVINTVSDGVLHNVENRNGAVESVESNAGDLGQVQVEIRSGDTPVPGVMVTPPPQVEVTPPEEPESPSGSQDSASSSGLGAVNPAFVNGEEDGPPGYNTVDTTNVAGPHLFLSIPDGKGGDAITDNASIVAEDSDEDEERRLFLSLLYIHPFHIIYIIFPHIQSYRVLMFLCTGR